jgi:hypothetical protein
MMPRRITEGELLATIGMDQRRMSQRVNEAERAQILDCFNHHQPDSKQIVRIMRLRRAAKEFASRMCDECPAGPDLNYAIALFRTVNQLAISSVIFEGGAIAVHVGKRVKHRKTGFTGTVVELVDAASNAVKVDFDPPFDQAANPVDTFGEMLTDITGKDSTP